MKTASISTNSPAKNITSLDIFRLPDCIMSLVSDEPINDKNVEADDIPADNIPVSIIKPAGKGTIFIAAQTKFVLAGEM